MTGGAAPPGARSEAQAALWVRRMFDRVAPRYDLLNHLLSFHIDRYWRWQTVRLLQPVIANPSARIVDLCCGSGDLTLALAAASSARVFGSDFSHQMLLAAAQKCVHRRARVKLFEADALALPLASDSCDLVTAAFGFRNLSNYQRGLAELLRVLRPGGTAAILEFTTPPNALIRGLYHFYARRLLPVIGGAISGSREAYAYLPESVRLFPAALALAGQFREAGFEDVTFRYFTVGIVALHTARKPR